MKILGVIPARGGSKGLPRKNIKNLNGKPMLAYTIEAAKESKKLEHFIVSTEDAEIKAIAESYGAEVMDRPLDLAGDEAQTGHVMDYVAQNYKPQPKAMVLLQPTSPLRMAAHIDEAITYFYKGHYDSVISACSFAHFVWVLGMQCPFPLNYDPIGRRPRRQDKLSEYLENGAIYIMKTKRFLESHMVLPGRMGIYVMPEEYQFEIDTEFDFWLCEQILKKGGR